MHDSETLAFIDSGYGLGHSDIGPMSKLRAMSQPTTVKQDVEHGIVVVIGCKQHAVCGTPVTMLGLLVELLLMRVSLPLTLGLAAVLSITIGTLGPILQQQNGTQITQFFGNSCMETSCCCNIIEKCTH